MKINGMRRAVCLQLLLIFVFALSTSAFAASNEFYYDQLNDKQKEIYGILYKAYKDDIDLSNNADKSDLEYSDDHYVVNLPLAKTWVNASNSVITDDLSGLYREYAVPAYVALISDHPELCWISYTSLYSEISNDCWTYEWNSKYNSFDYTLNYFSVYIKDIGYSKGTSATINRGLKSLKSDIDSYLPSKASRYETVKAIHDKICNTVAYENSNLDNYFYQTIYSVFNDVDGDGIIETVCAGYSKTFKAMCDLYGIPCVLVHGTSVNRSGSGSHMWNFVQMEDGKWYAVDVTWDDQSSGIYYTYFLVGAQTLPPSYALQLTFEKSHISEKIDSRSSLEFAYPALNDEAYGLLKITSQPAGKTLTEGDVAKFKVTASGIGLTYLWQTSTDGIYWRNSGYVSAVKDTLTFTSKKSQSGSYYRCIVTDSLGNEIVSKTVKLTVNSKFAIITQPVKTTVTEGSAAKFSVTATGQGLTYQWQTSADGSSWRNSGYTSATSSTLKFTSKYSQNGSYYRCVITDATGRKLTSSAVKLTVRKKLEITAQPVKCSVKAGSTASFALVASGEGLTYQWQVSKDGSSWRNSGYTSATKATIKFTSKTSQNGDYYRCIIKDAYGKTVTTSTVRLYVK